jgi:hypothetical protein
MALPDLQAELGLDLKPGEEQEYWEELVSTARAYRDTLGEGPQVKTAQDYLEDLKKEIQDGEIIRFSPNLNVVALNQELFQDLHLNLEPYLANLLKHYSFFLVHIPVILSPRRGWTFKELRCIVEFNPGQEPQNRPVAYQIFPAEEWQRLFQCTAELNIGLDGNLQFKVDPQELPSLENLGLPAKVAAELKGGMKGRFLVGPFNYYLMQPRITAKGRDDVKVIWNLFGERQVTQSNPRLGVVLKVPREISRVDIAGVLLVYPSFRLLGEGFWHVVKVLSAAAKNFFQQGAPIIKECPWEDITARA